MRISRRTIEIDSNFLIQIHLFHNISPSFLRESLSRAEEITKKCHTRKFIPGCHSFIVSSSPKKSEGSSSVFLQRIWDENMSCTLLASESIFRSLKRSPRETEIGHRIFKGKGVDRVCRTTENNNNNNESSGKSSQTQLRDNDRKRCNGS